MVNRLLEPRGRAGSRLVLIPRLGRTFKLDHSTELEKVAGLSADFFHGGARSGSITALCIPLDSGILREYLEESIGVGRTMTGRD